jgi:hypothetical protein
LYVGVYAIVESIDKRFIERVEGANANGYLFEYRWRDKWSFGYLGADLNPYRERFAPRTHERDADKLLYGPIEALVRTVNDQQVGISEIRRYLNVETFLRQLAVEAFLADWDGLIGDFGINNFYLYKLKEADEFHFFPWDKDHAFKANDYPVWPEGLNENALTRRLMAEDGPREYFLQALLECAEKAESREAAAGPNSRAGLPWLQRELEAQYAQIVEAVRADGRKPQSNRLFEEAVDGLREFARSRPDVVRAFVASKRKT